MDILLLIADIWIGGWYAHTKAGNWAMGAVIGSAFIFGLIGVGLSLALDGLGAFES